MSVKANMKVATLYSSLNCLVCTAKKSHAISYAKFEQIEKVFMTQLQSKRTRESRLVLFRLTALRSQTSPTAT